MKDFSYIDYELLGKKHRYYGMWPEEPAAADALGEAFYRLCQTGKPFTEADTIREAGGTVLDIHSVRPDGSIRGEDLPHWHTD